VLGARHLRRFVASLRRNGVERDLDDEVRFHLTTRADRNTREA